MRYLIPPLKIGRDALVLELDARTNSYQLIDAGEVIFEGSDFIPGGGSDFDGLGAAADLAGFLSCRPGDVDPEYFANYTPEQMEWIMGDGPDALALWAAEIEGAIA